MTVLIIKKTALIFVSIVMLFLTGCSLEIEMNVNDDYSGQFKYSINESNVYTKEVIEEHIKKYIAEENKKFDSKVYTLESIRKDDDKLVVCIEFSNLKDEIEKTAFVGTYENFLDMSIPYDEISVMKDEDGEVTDLKDLKNKKNLNVVYINKEKLSDNGKIEEVSFEIEIPGKIRYCSDNVELNSDNKAIFKATSSVIFYEKNDPFMNYLMIFSGAILLILILYILFKSYNKEIENCIKCGNKLLKDTKYCSECGHKIDRFKIDFDKLNKKIIAIMLIIVILNIVGYKFYKTFNSAVTADDLEREDILESIDGSFLYEKSVDTNGYEIKKDNIKSFKIESSNKDGDVYETTGTMKAISDNLVLSGDYTLVHTYLNKKWKIVSFYISELEKTPYSGPKEDEIRRIMGNLNKSISLTEKSIENSLYLDNDSVKEIIIENRKSEIEKNKDEVVFDMIVEKDLISISIRIIGQFKFENEMWNLSDYEIDYESIEYEYLDESIEIPETVDELKEMIISNPIDVDYRTIYKIPKEFNEEYFGTFTMTEKFDVRAGSEIEYKGYFEYNDEELEFKEKYKFNISYNAENDSWSKVLDLDRDGTFKTATRLQLLNEIVDTKIKIGNKDIILEKEFISDFEVIKIVKDKDEQNITVSFRYNSENIDEVLKFKILYVNSYEMSFGKPERIN